VEQPDGRWRADAVRDVAVSIGHFRIVHGTAEGGVAVTVGVEEQVADDAQGYLDKVVASIDDFHDRFGPYPWPALSVALTPGLGGGIEYPMHILQGPGTIGRTTPHEVGHMWFYGLVGNDQGRDPWLDEGLATWAEARFLGNLGTFTGRAIPRGARNETGRPMTYWEGRQDSYYEGVYVQGAQALAALGDADGVDCALRHYVAANAFRVARPADLLRSLEVVFPDALATLAAFGALA
jgi:aminopeptidase N